MARAASPGGRTGRTPKKSLRLRCSAPSWGGPAPSGKRSWANFACPRPATSRPQLARMSMGQVRGAHRVVGLMGSRPGRRCSRGASARLTRRPPVCPRRQSALMNRIARCLCALRPQSKQLIHPLCHSRSPRSVGKRAGAALAVFGICFLISASLVTAMKTSVRRVRTAPPTGPTSRIVLACAFGTATCVAR